MSTKKISCLACLLLFKICLFAQDIPAKSNTLVTDYTNTLSQTEIQQLESKLVKFDDSTSTQIAVVILKTVNGYDIKKYGDTLGRAWGIGQQGKNNGILVLVAMDDHKVAIRTGYGAEAAVPDVTAREIIENDITPSFKRGDYFGGLDAATNKLISLMKGEYHQNDTATDKTTPWANGVDWSSIALTLFVLAFIAILVLRRRSSGGQIIDSRGSADTFWWFSSNQTWGGGDSSSDDNNSSGDFGGFGGGDFGGGGSDGSW